MKRFAWNDDKNGWLQANRGITFNEIVRYIRNGHVLDVIEHPNQEQYPNQRMFVVQIADYVWLIPFVESEQEIFFKTAMPSRKMTKRYLGN